MEVKGKKFMVCVSGGADGLAAALRLHVDGGEVVAVHNQSTSVTKLGDYYSWKIVKRILERNGIKCLEVDVDLDGNESTTHNAYSDVLLATLKSTLEEYPDHIWSTGARIDDRARGDLEMALEESGHPWYTPLTKYGTADKTIFEGLPKDLHVTLSSCDFGMWGVGNVWGVMCGAHAPRRNWCFKCHMSNRIVSLVELGLLIEEAPEGVTLSRLGDTVVVQYGGRVIYTEITTVSLNDLPIYKGDVLVDCCDDKIHETRSILTHKQLMALTCNEACDGDAMRKAICVALDVDNAKIVCVK